MFRTSVRQGGLTANKLAYRLARLHRYSATELANPIRPYDRTEKASRVAVQAESAVVLAVLLYLDAFQIAEGRKDQCQIFASDQVRDGSERRGLFVEKPMPGAGRSSSLRSGNQSRRARSRKSVATARFNFSRSAGTRLSSPTVPKYDSHSRPPARPGTD